jgi:hypothetical protein
MKLNAIISYNLKVTYPTILRLMIHFKIPIMLIDDY